MELCRGQVHPSQLLIAHDDPRLIMVGIDCRFHDQKRLRLSVGDKIDNHFIAGERTSAPILGDEAKEPVLVLVPLARPQGKWQISRGRPDLSAKFSRAVFHRRLRLPLLPTPTHAGGGELSRVMVNDHNHPTLVAGQIVDPIGNRLALLRIWRIVNFHFNRLPLWTPFLTSILKFPHQPLLFGVDGHYRLPVILKHHRPWVDVFKLSASILMRGTFTRLPVGLQALARGFQQGCDCRVADWMLLASQLLRLGPCALARPAQGGLRVTSGRRVHQKFQGLLQTRIPLCH